jgi:hypothetical protein
MHDMGVACDETGAGARYQALQTAFYMIWEAIIVQFSGHRSLIFF